MSAIDVSAQPNTDVGQKSDRADFPIFNDEERKKSSATHVVRGMILDIMSLWENGSIYSVAQMEPRLWLKNRTEHDRLSLKYRGGVVGDIEQVSFPGVRFQIGEEATVFMKQEQANRFRPVWKEDGQTLALSASSSFEPGGLGYALTYPYEGALHMYLKDTTLSLTPDPSHGTTDISGDEEWGAIGAALNVWNQATLTLSLSLGATGSCEPGKHDEGTGSPINCIGWVASLPDNDIAGTDRWTCPFVGNDACPNSDINEVDIRFNDSYNWSLNPGVGEVDLQGTAVHELGHSIGLEHVGAQDELETLYPGVARPGLGITATDPRGSLMDRTLFWGDLAGAKYLYPREYDVSPGQWIGATTEGADVALYDLNNNRYPELFFLWVDAPSGPNKIYYRVGWELGFRSMGEIFSWQTGEIEKPDWVGDHTQGAGIAVGRLDGNEFPDLVIAWVDNPSGDNSIWYEIGYDLVGGPTPSRWSGALLGIENIGHDTADVAVAIQDIDGDTVPDIYFSWVDDAPFGNTIAYGILDSPPVRGTLLTGIDSTTNGYGITFADYNGDGLKDLLAVWGVIVCGEQICVTNETKYRVGWSVGSTGVPASWASTRHIPGGWTAKGTLGGLGVSTWDLNGNGREDMVFLWKSGEDSATYVVEWESAFENLTPSQNDAGQTRDAGNTWAEARLSSSGQGYLIGQDNLGDTQDWYQFSVTKDYDVSTTMTPPVGADFDLELYDPSENPRASSSQRAPGLGEALRFTADKNGSWRIRISIHDQGPVSPSIGVYSFSVSILSPPGPPGGGGCGGHCHQTSPYLSTYDGINWYLDNNLLPQSLSPTRPPGADVTDLYRVQQPLARTDSHYSLRVQELGLDVGYLDQIRLFTVDHASNVRIGVTPTGQLLTYQTPSAPTRATSSSGLKVLRLVGSMDGLYYEGLAGDWVTVDFGALDMSGGAKLVVRSASLERPSVIVQVLVGQGHWASLASLPSRTFWAIDLVDLKPYLPDSEGKLRVRLYLTSSHRVDFIGLDTTAQASTSVQEVALVGAIHTNGTDVTNSILASDNLVVQLRPAEGVQLTFRDAVPAIGTRGFIILIEGYYEALF